MSSASQRSVFSLDELATRRDAIEALTVRCQQLQDRVQFLEESQGMPPAPPGETSREPFLPPTTLRGVSEADPKAELASRSKRIGELQIEVNTISDKVWAMRSNVGEPTDPSVSQLIEHESELLRELSRARAEISKLRRAMAKLPD